MKLNKKGFTLVELLAVIVILAVVMLIAVTSVGPMMEKSRKSSLGTEGLGMIKAAETAFQAEGLKGTKAAYTSTSDVCFSLKYLCVMGYFEKGCGSDGYTGSVLADYNAGNMKYSFWVTNGTYSFGNATSETYGDIENTSVVKDDNSLSSESCGTFSGKKCTCTGNEKSTCACA